MLLTVLYVFIKIMIFQIMFLQNERMKIFSCRRLIMKELECFVRCVNGRHPDILLKDGVPYDLGRGPDTKIKDSKCSR